MSSSREISAAADRPRPPEARLELVERLPVVEVAHGGGDRFEIRVRDHVIVVDQPVDIGGTDTGPTPTELFVAGLASCVAFYARRYLARHHLDTSGLRVTAEYLTASRPSRVAAVAVTVHVPPGLPAARQEALLGVASRCTVHNSITHTPEILVRLAEEAGGHDGGAPIASAEISALGME